MLPGQVLDLEWCGLMKMKYHDKVYDQSSSVSRVPISLLFIIKYIIEAEIIFSYWVGWKWYGHEMCNYGCMRGFGCPD